jgi:hypothetical protein
LVPAAIFRASKSIVMVYRVLRSYWLLLALLLSSQLVAGQAFRGTYLLFTFEETASRSPHGTQTYYWLQPLDSIAHGPLLRPLFMQGFSQQDELACCQGQAINPYAVTQSSSYNFDQPHYAAVDSLRHLLQTQRRKMQTIRKRWASGQQQTLTVYLTPVSGVFCAANFLQVGLYATSCAGRLYLPRAKFVGVPSFWHRSESQQVAAWDYSRVPFAIFPHD